MKIRINIPKNTALLRGSDTHGDMVIDVPAATLSDQQRAWLAEQGGSTGCDYDLSQLTRQAELLPPEATADGVRDLIDRARAQEADIEAEQAAEKIRREAERRAEAEEQARLPVREQLAFPDCSYRRPRSPLADYPDLCGPALAECARLAAEAEAEEQAARAAKEAAEADRAAWIESHGSPRLRRATAEGIECDAIYRDERLALDRPGWVFDTARLTTSLDEPRNPPIEAFDLLDRARQVEPTAELIYWSRDERTDEYGEVVSEAVRGYAAEADFYGRCILLMS